MASCTSEFTHASVFALWSPKCDWRKKRRRAKFQKRRKFSFLLAPQSSSKDSSRIQFRCHAFGISTLVGFEQVTHAKLEGKFVRNGWCDVLLREGLAIHIPQQYCYACALLSDVFPRIPRTSLIRDLSKNLMKRNSILSLKSNTSPVRFFTDLVHPKHAFYGFDAN